MNGNDLPENDHIVHYVKPRNVEDGQVSIAEFRLRENEKGVSGNWLEYYENLSKEEQLAEVRVASRLVLRKNGRFAGIKCRENQRFSGRRTARLASRPHSA